MTEFVGRTGSKRVYSYPETPRTASALALARNFAYGPGTTTSIGTSATPVPWNAIGVGSPGINVPITPRVTGLVRVSGVICVKSLSGIQESVNVQVVVNGVPLLSPFFEVPTVEAGGAIAIPILTEIDVFTNGGSQLPLGATANVQIVLSASNDGVLELATQSSSLELQEVLAETG